jgi:transposase
LAIRYKVTLTKEERESLEGLTKDGKTQSKLFLHARALLLCDASEDGPKWIVNDVAEALGVTNRTIEHLKKRFVEEGLAQALARKQREIPPREIVYDGAFEARLLQLACSDAPKGYSRWTVRLLSEKIVELKIAPACSAMAVCRTLKKTNYSLVAANTGKYRPIKTRPL